MLQDEKIFPQMRVFYPHVSFDNLPNIYCYYFYDCKTEIQQRMQTLHLAMSYYTQCYTKMCNMGINEIRYRYPRISHFIKTKVDLTQILVPSCLLLASKFDEIDYSLPSFDYLKTSDKLKHFWLGFRWIDYVEFERIITDLLDWNLDQMTPYHFLQVILSQGIVLSHEKIRTVERSPSPISKPSLTIREPYGGRSQSVRRGSTDQSTISAYKEIELTRIKSGTKDKTYGFLREDLKNIDSTV